MRQSLSSPNSFPFAVPGTGTGMGHCSHRLVRTLRVALAGSHVSQQLPGSRAARSPCGPLGIRAVKSQPHYSESSPYFHTRQHTAGNYTRLTSLPSYPLYPASSLH